MAARLGSPFGVVLQQFDIEPIQAAGRLDIKGAFADLLDGGDASERQEEAKVVVEIRIGAGDGRIVGGEVFGLQRVAIGGKDETGLATGGGGAGAQVAMWMLLVCSTPPRSDLFDTPVRRRLRVVSLFPKASRN